MSKWTHVTLTAEVCSAGWKSPEELRAQVLEEIGWGKCGITGSEGNASVYVIPLKSSATRFEGNKTWHLFENALVVVHGHLRDRTKKETKAEVELFVWLLQHRFSIIRDLHYDVWEDLDEPYFCNDEETEE